MRLRRGTADNQQLSKLLLRELEKALGTRECDKASHWLPQLYSAWQRNELMAAAFLNVSQYVQASWSSRRVGLQHRS